MSDAFYADIVTTVNEVLAQFGKIFRITAPGKFEVNTSSTGAPIEYDVLGVVAEGTYAKQMLSLAGNTAPFVEGKYVILSPDTELDTSMSIEVDGQVYAMDKLEKVRPASVTVCYMINVGK